MNCDLKAGEAMGSDGNKILVQYAARRRISSA